MTLLDILLALLFLVVLLFILASLFLFGLSALLAKHGMWLSAGCAAAVAVVFTFGPWANAKIEAARLNAQVIEASYWPETLDLQGGNILVISDRPGKDNCGRLCKTLKRKLDETGGTVFDAPGLARETLGTLRRHLEGHPGAPVLRVRNLSTGQDVPFADMRQSVDVTVVVVRANPFWDELVGPLALPELFREETTSAIYVFEKEALWTGGAPIARMVSVKAYSRGVLPLSGDVKRFPDGCAGYTAAWDAWVGDGGLSWHHGTGLCPQLYH